MIRFHRTARWARACLLAATPLFATCAFGCGGAKDSVTAKAPATLTAEQIDADPVALLPGAPSLVSHVDARALLATPYGEALGRLADKLMPVGDESGFLASRDVDAIWSAAYAGQGLDSVAVVRGKFDEAKLEGAATKQARARGGLVVKSTYAERSVYTVSNVAIVVLTAKTALVGTEPGVRRALDRVRDARLQRSVPTWMLDTIDTPGAIAAVAADFDTQPIPPELKSQIPVGWLKNVKTAKIVGMSDGGMRVKAHLTYPSPDAARDAERGLKQAQTIASTFAITGVVPRIQDPDIKSDGSDVDCRFRVDERRLSSLLQNAQRWLGG